jgi:hypothetical protein
MVVDLYLSVGRAVAASCGSGLGCEGSDFVSELAGLVGLLAAPFVGMLVGQPGEEVVRDTHLGPVR